MFNVMIGFTCMMLVCIVSFGSCQLEEQTSKVHSSPNTSIEHEMHVAKEEMIEDIATPIGFERTTISDQSFGHYLRNLPLKEDPLVYLFNGTKKANQNAHYTVIDRSPSNRDLMQCADAVIRLRSEYLFHQGHIDDISFNFVSGDTYRFNDYLAGKTPRVSGNQVNWNQGNSKPNNEQSLSNYLDWVYSYAGTASLVHELKSCSITDIQIGDVFIQSRDPYGHAVIVVDLCVNSTTQEKAFLLAQSYMPAQDLHILKNPISNQDSPWYVVTSSDQIRTPEWTFFIHDLKRF